MKSLSLVKPLVLVMIGLPGSGKSFFARQFSETFGAPIVSHDKIQHILYKNPQYDKNEFGIIQQVANSQLEELLKTQKTFILDGGGNSRAQRMELRKTVRVAGYDTMLVWVQTDTNTSQYRSMKRTSQRLDDLHKQSLSAEQYELLSKRFSPPISSEALVVVSGKHTYPTQAKVVLKKLVIPRQENISAHLASKHDTTNPTSFSERPMPRRNIMIR